MKILSSWEKWWGPGGLAPLLALEEARKRYLSTTKANKAREAADLGICEASSVAGAQSLLDLSLAGTSFGSVTLIHKI